MILTLLRTARLVICGLTITMVSTCAQAGESRLFQLENEQSLRVESTPYSRVLPYAFFDQAMASLPQLYPEVEIRVQRRLGRLGNDPVRLYALIGYRENPASEEIVLRGILTQTDRAWTFDLKTTHANFDQTLLLVLEFLSGPDF